MVSIVNIIEEIVSELNDGFTFVLGSGSEQNVLADDLPPPFAFMNDDFDSSTNITQSETQQKSYTFGLDFFYENTGNSDTGHQRAIIKEQALTAQAQFIHLLSQHPEVKNISGVRGELISFSSRADIYITGLGGAYTVEVYDRKNYC